MNAVGDSGDLLEADDFSFDSKILISTMEALLIEGLEPPQNRKSGDEFRAIEFIQVADPAILKRQKAELLKMLQEKIYEE